METILIVDDNKDMQFTLANILKDQGYETITASDGERAIKEVKTRSPNLVLLDIRLPGIDGMKILKEMKRIDKELIIIMLTAYGDVKNAVDAMKLGAFDYVTKPFNNEELTLIIKNALRTQYLSKEVESLRKRLGEKTVIEEVMGESPAIKQVLNQVNIIAPTNMTVIIQGESGTGKELIAQMIHQKSRRADKPFVAVDCGAIPETLVESELFGYEKGAFTGADERKEGKFEVADGGTLFLDEITNLSDAIQMKLLRVVQERKIQHLGGKKDIRIDVRIIVATKVNLFEAVRAGKFRDDLFHRFNEFHINLPLLRERKEDIPVLAKYFLDEANQELNKKIKRFSGEAMKFLLSYPWPGNVRELKNLIKKAVLLTDSEYVPLENLSTNMTGSASVADFAPEAHPPLAEKENLESPASFKEKSSEFEKELIKNALEKAGGNKIKAAKILQIHRKALYRKMKSLSL
ncbi:MAG: sigma-54 dependent transcriptional regulator [Candidatus Omnitrophota bacterium]|nr:sigma-54 dependent transcriptional regulator [Candidatus Omnitrophota bacterium]